MSDITGYDIGSKRALGTNNMPRGPQWTETYWGLSVRDVSEISGWTVGKQIVSFIFGAGCLVAAIGIWMTQPSAWASDQLVMRMAVSGALGILSYILISYANRGTTRELQFDHNMGEIREVSVGRNGATHLLGQHGADAFENLTITQHSPTSASLVLDRIDGGKGLLVSKGYLAQIAALHQRLERDMLRSSSKRSHDAVNPNTH